jgi:hypothetical protein
MFNSTCIRCVYIAAFLPAACGGHVELGVEPGTGAGGTVSTSGSGGGSLGGAGGYPDGAAGAGGSVPLDATPPALPVICPSEMWFHIDADDAEPGSEACPCTRRPGAPPSHWCAAGDGTSVTILLTPEGGTFELGGRQADDSGVNVRLSVPRGAVGEPVWVTLTETTCPPAASFVDASPLYQFAPLDLVFARSVDIRIPYGTGIGQSASASIPPVLSIFFLSSVGNGERVADSYINAGFMQGSITHFGSLFAGYPKSAAEAACP